ncbi:capZ-interacting protein-like isoform X1 [Pristis pectinata]|uniref:capZ-interacting protein-like isoform X1 n=1 Tax=Pristis pectinata TaxID=685728 RepID=UPI00223D88BE|nr:capZ-interacting protein-like isoform X1 [Pristis pectinata]XP_051870242.1 capZ-interacting protein-like isoform X1 [Pristis pectinata]XP_051870244.1 capZ-interacting protein-like isoform X1 [Pristis pectinata]XP_051870245.1 capZ-interacting protein-like isoform X1 [Pristis pectinata]XP_051870246.1 capZ-interacting protein-like isoform X1 [Pristis pectinata]XP_051870247.1 capZ-interacting protein-like isoform X1 [Pristis pectinata]XP_051870248.1 capZ-interacting protein-like isoform X1 [Pr
MEEKPMSVAALASKFNHKTSDTLEKDEKCPRGPIRRKPPCSLPLYGNKNNVKTETDHNGDEKPPINEASRPPKLKLKNSSPLIEKLQATLLLSPTALVPGVGPKSPLKSSFSPFASPASTPESPGMHSLSSESDGSVVTIDQPREAEPLQSLHKNRARLSMKRRPPSRRFRRSATDADSPETEQSDNSAKEVEPKQRGAAEEGNDEVFTDQVQIDNGDAHSSAEGEAHSSPRSSAEGEAHSTPRSSAEGEAHSTPRSSAEGEAHSSPRSSAEGEAQSTPRSSADLSPGEPAQKMPSDPLSSQSQESETCTANQDEYAEDNNIASKMILESADKDNESSDNIVHNPAGSETVVTEMSNQELKTEEVKATDNEQQIVNAEEKPSEAIE